MWVYVGARFGQGYGLVRSTADRPEGIAPGPRSTERVAGTFAGDFRHVLRTSGRLVVGCSNLNRTDPRPTCLKRLRVSSPMGLGSSRTNQRSGEKT